MTRTILLLAAAIAIVVSGCSSSKHNLTYFTDIMEYQEGSIAVDSASHHARIAPDDELSITVSSVNPRATADYNLPLINPAQGLANPETVNGQEQQTYIVNRLGDINFPVLGTIHVEGMTTDELTRYLTERISERVVDPIVKVSLLNFTINILGEVSSPGIKKVDKQQFSLLDAIAAAGDLTNYGQRDNILVIRETDGKKTYARLNLQDSRIMESPYFYLKQNDIVYVEPNKIREANTRYNTDNAYKLSVISAVISGVTVVTSLIIALVR